MWRETRTAQCLETAAKALMVLAIFALPFPVSLHTIPAALALVCWFASGDLGAKLRRPIESPVGIGALVLLALLALGMAYSSADAGESWAVFRKYAKLLYIPVMISMFHEPLWRRRALAAFGASLGLVLVLSYGKLLGAVPADWIYPNYVIAKTHILHSLLMALLLYLLLSWALRYPRWRWWCVVGMVAVAYNLFFMIPGRVGYVLFPVLLMVLLFERWRWRGLAGALGVGTALLLLVIGVSPVVQERIATSTKEITLFEQAQARGGHVSDGNSLGLRLEHYYNTLRLIARHPVLGAGTGSWQREYRALVDDERAVVLSNTHNDYLMWAAQLGVVGLAIYVVFLFSQWRLSFRLDDESRVWAQGIVTMIVVAGAFNSSLLYSHEGKVYVALAGVLFAGLRRGAKAAGELNRPEPREVP